MKMLDTVAESCEKGGVRAGVETVRVDNFRWSRQPCSVLYLSRVFFTRCEPRRLLLVMLQTRAEITGEL